jgi:uncharacterized protein (TIGR00251 family)
MTRSTTRYSDKAKGTVLAVRVTPRAKKNEITQILDDGTIKIRLTSPPVAGKANAALIKLLAEILDVSSSSIEVVSGESSRSKLIYVTDLEPQIADLRIEEALSRSG